MSGLCLGLREGCGDGVCAISSWKDASIPGRSCIPRRLGSAELGPDTPREAAPGQPVSGHSRDSSPGTSGTGRGGGSAELPPLPRPRPLPLAGRERGRAGPGEEEQAELGPDRGGSSGAPEVCAAGGGGSRPSSRRFRGPAGGAGRAGKGGGSGRRQGTEPSRDEEAGREGGAAGGHERGQDLLAAPLHGAALPGDGQHRRRRLLPEAVGAVQHLHLGHRR